MIPFAPVLAGLVDSAIASVILLSTHPALKFRPAQPVPGGAAGEYRKRFCGGLLVVCSIHEQTGSATCAAFLKACLPIEGGRYVPTLYGILP